MAAGKVLYNGGMKVKTMLALSLAVVCSVLSAAIPEIRYTAAAPFGNRVESAWKKADTCVRFVTVKTMDVAIDQSEAQLLFDDKNLYASMTGFFDPKFARGDRKNSMGRTPIGRIEGVSQSSVFAGRWSHRFEMPFSQHSLRMKLGIRTVPSLPTASMIASSTVFAPPAM